MTDLSPQATKVPGPTEHAPPGWRSFKTPVAQLVVAAIFLTFAILEAISGGDVQRIVLDAWLAMGFVVAVLSYLLWRTPVEGAERWLRIAAQVGFGIVYVAGFICLMSAT